MSAVDVVYQVEGAGPPLYLVHGIGARHSTWKGLIPHLREHFTCVTFDLRGHGQSPIPPTPYSLEDLAEDVEGVRLKLGHEKIHVAGHSLGGMIGPAYARAYPNRCLSVGLLSTAAGRTEEDRAKLKNVIGAMHEKGIEQVLGTLVNRWYTDEFVAANPAVVENRIKQVVGTPAHVFLDVFRIYAETEMAPWLSEISCPCLVLTAEFDGGCNPRLNRFIDSQLPNSELVILERYKHSILIEAPEIVAAHMRRFLLALPSDE